MLKEIHEQPKAVQDTVGAYVKDGQIDFSETGITSEMLAGAGEALYRCLRVSISCRNGGKICDGGSGGYTGGSGLGI